MKFCDTCSSAMVKIDDKWLCKSCSPDAVESKSTTSDGGTPDPRPAKLNKLPKTDSGAVRKKDAMKWLNSLDRPTDQELRDIFVPKPKEFTGSTYPTSISNIRITGDPKFIETVAGLLKPIDQLEGTQTRVEINLQQTDNRDTGETTGNYALYLSVAKRG